MQLSDFDFDLPERLIATRPAPLPGAPQRQRAAAGTIAE